MTPRLLGKYACLNLPEKIETRPVIPPFRGPKLAPTNQYGLCREQAEAEFGRSESLRP